MGADHVGIGLDYVFDMEELNSYITKMKGTFPPGLGYEVGGGLRCVSPAQIEPLIELQLKAGYAEGEIRKILGQNMLRVARQVWKQ